MNKTFQSLHAQMQPDKAVKAELLEQVRNGRRAELSRSPRKFAFAAIAAALVLVVGLTGFLMLSKRLTTADSLCVNETYELHLSPLGEGEKAEMSQLPPMPDFEEKVWKNNTEIDFEGRHYTLADDLEQRERLCADGLNEADIIGTGTVSAYGNTYQAFVTTVEDSPKEQFIAVWLRESECHMYICLDSYYNDSYDDKSEKEIISMSVSAYTAQADNEGYYIDPAFFDSLNVTREQFFGFIESYDTISLVIDDAQTNCIYDGVRTNADELGEPYAKGTMTILYGDDSVTLEMQAVVFKDGESYAVQLQDGTVLNFKANESRKSVDELQEGEFIRLTDEVQDEQPQKYAITDEYRRYLSVQLGDLSYNLDNYKTDFAINGDRYTFKLDGRTYSIAYCRSEARLLADEPTQYIYKQAEQSANFTADGTAYRIPDETAAAICSHLWACENPDAKVEINMSGYTIGGREHEEALSMSEVELFNSLYESLSTDDCELVKTVTDGVYPDFREGARTIELKNSAGEWQRMLIAVDIFDGGELPLNNGMGGVRVFDLVVETEQGTQLYFVGSDWLFELEKDIKRLVNSHTVFSSAGEQNDFKKDVQLTINETYAAGDNIAIEDIALEIDQMELFEIMEGIGEVTFEGRTYRFTGQFGASIARTAAKGTVTADGRSYAAYICFDENGSLLIDMHTTPAVFAVE